MAFKAFLNSLEGVPEEWHTAYRKLEGESAGYQLDVEPVGGWTLEDVGALRRSYENESERRREAANNLKEWEGIGIPLSDVTTGLAELEELRRIDPEKEAEKLAQKKLEAGIEEVRTSANKEIETRDGRITRLTKALEDRLVVDVAREALAKHGGSEALLMPHIERQVKIEWGDDDTPIVKVLNDQGSPRMKDVKTGALMGIEDLVLSMKETKDYGGAFSGAGAAGGGAGGSGESSPAGGAGDSGEPKHRNDFPSNKEKAAWINKNGHDKFLSLPMPPKETPTKTRG
jgi:hypothetical protein